MQKAKWIAAQLEPDEDEGEEEPDLGESERTDSMLLDMTQACDDDCGASISAEVASKDEWFAERLEPGEADDEEEVGEELDTYLFDSSDSASDEFDGYASEDDESMYCGNAESESEEGWSAESIGDEDDSEMDEDEVAGSDEEFYSGAFARMPPLADEIVIEELYVRTMEEWEYPSEESDTSLGSLGSTTDDSDSEDPFA